MFKFLTKTITLDPNPELLLANQEKSRRIFILETEIAKKENDMRRTRMVVPVDINDPTPEDSKLRASFVARGSEYFEDVFRPKLMRLIAIVREDLDNPNAIETFSAGTTRTEADFFLRGVSNGFKMLLDWGDEMVAEHGDNLRRAAGVTEN